MSMDIDFYQIEFPEAIKCVKNLQRYAFKYFPAMISKLMTLESE